MGHDEKSVISSYLADQGEFHVRAMQPQASTIPCSYSKGVSLRAFYTFSQSIGLNSKSQSETSKRRTQETSQTRQGYMAPMDFWGRLRKCKRMQTTMAEPATYVTRSWEQPNP